MARKWHKFCWSVLLLAHSEQSDTFDPILLGCLCITFNNVYRELSSFIRRVSNFNPFSTTKLSCCYFILFLFDQCLCHCVIINDSGKKKGLLYNDCISCHRALEWVFILCIYVDLHTNSHKNTLNVLYHVRGTTSNFCNPSFNSAKVRRKEQKPITGKFSHVVV